MQLENTTLTGVTQAKKGKYYMFSLYVDPSFGTVIYVHLGGSKWAKPGSCPIGGGALRERGGEGNRTYVI